jgi:hypothetical protein
MIDDARRSLCSSLSLLLCLLSPCVVSPFALSLSLSLSQVRLMCPRELRTLVRDAILQHLKSGPITNLFLRIHFNSWHGAAPGAAAAFTANSYAPVLGRLQAAGIVVIVAVLQPEGIVILRLA